MIVPLTPVAYYRRAGELFASKVGVVDGDRRLTYGELAERIDRLSGALRGLGVRPGQVVSFITPNCHQLLEGYYGVPQVGAIMNPINIRLFPDEIAYILEHAESDVVVFSRELLPLVEQVRQTTRQRPRYVVLEGPAAELPFETIDYEAWLADAEPYRADLDALDERAPCELFYTSGTTARPKGVILSHRTLAVHAFSWATTFSHTEAEVVLQVVPLYHANGWGIPQSVTAVGGRHIMLRRFDPETFLRLIQEERVTFSLGVPTVFNAVVNCERLAEYDVSSLRMLVCGGAPVPEALIEAAERALGCPLIQGYGLTETAPLLTAAFPKTTFAGDEARIRAAKATTGLPVLGAEVRVFKTDGVEVAHDGEEVGEIACRSDHVMDGYYKDPEGTAAAIRGGWFYTGDMAVVDAEGYIKIVDRKKDIIITGGINVTSIDVEDCLYSHPDVYECAVIAVPDERWGEAVKAVVVPKPGADLTEEGLIAYCKSRIAAFKVPKSVDFVEALPKSGTGKILKREVRATYWQGRDRQVN